MYRKPGGLSVVGLAGAYRIESLEIDDPVWRVIVLCRHMHPALACDGCVEGHLLQHTQADIPHETGVHRLLPVEGHH